MENMSAKIPRDGQQCVGSYDGSLGYRSLQQSQFSPESSYTTQQSYGYDSNGGQQEIIDFFSAQYPTTNHEPPVVYNPHWTPLIHPFTSYPTMSNPTTYPTTYPTNGSMPQYLEQAPALSNSNGTYASPEVCVMSANTGGRFSYADAAPVWVDNRHVCSAREVVRPDYMWIAPEYGPACHHPTLVTAPGAHVQVAQQGGCHSLSCQAAWTGEHSCSNRSTGRESQPPPPTPPPHVHVDHSDDGSNPGPGTEKAMRHVYCPIARCKRGLGNRRGPFRRNCNLLEHLRGVHGKKIPLKTKLTRWFPEHGFELEAYLVWVKRGVRSRGVRGRGRIPGEGKRAIPKIRLVGPLGVSLGGFALDQEPEGIP